MKTTRVAVGTADGVSVCDHLARSAAFLVFEIEEGQVKSKTTRNRWDEQCGNHATFMELAEGCEAVICAGIGEGAYRALAANGIKPVVLAKAMTVDEAVSGYLAGTLVTTSERVCLCSH